MFGLGHKIAFITLCFVIYSCTGASDVINKDIIVRKYERKIDLSTQLVKTIHKINIENAGSSPVKYFLFMLTSAENDKLSYLDARVGSYSLTVTPATIANHPGYSFYRVDLRDVLQAGKAAALIEVEVVLSHILQLYPASIAQGEKQLVVYEGSHFVPAPYTVVSQTTAVTLPSPNIESYTKMKPVSHADTTITYGAYENTPAFSMDPMKIHYESNGPFLTITHLERVLEISHWGNIAVEETMDMVHTGAKLKGSFSRYDYQREHNTYNIIKSLRSVLPASAKDVYYRDEIGNISTSNLRVREDSVEVDLRPRFPLLGGWKTHYKLGYNVPSYEYLYNSGDKYALKMRFMDHVFDDMVVEEMILKVILPEGVKDIQFNPPFPVKRLADSVHPTYLDTVGRVVVTLQASKLNALHIQDFVLTYTFPGILMLQEPLLVVAVFLALFIVVMVWVRIDLTLSPDKQSEAKMRVSSHCSLVATHHHKRTVLYNAMLDEITKQQGLGNPPHALAQFQASIKKLQAAVKEETQTISEFHSKIRSDNAEMAERVSDLQKIDKEVRDIVSMECTNMEKLLGKKMAKQMYADNEAILTKKREDAMERAVAVVKLL